MKIIFILFYWTLWIHFGVTELKLEKIIVKNKNSTKVKCNTKNLHREQTKPIVDIPPELQKYNGELYIGFVNENDVDGYIVAPNTTSFAITCASNFPVDWRFTGSLANTVVQSRETLSFDDFKDGVTINTCYYNTLTFKSVENEITGLYTCLALTVKGKWDHVKFFIFSGLSALTISNRTLTYDNHITKQSFGKTEHELPCALNHPAAYIYLFFKDSKESDWLRLNISHHIPGVGIQVTLQDELHLKSRYYKCEGILNLPKNNIYIRDVLYLEIPKYADSYFLPSIPNVEYNIPFDGFRFFICISKFPIEIVSNHSDPRIVVNMNLGVQGKQNIITKSGYLYQLEARLSYLFQHSNITKYLEVADKLICVDKLSRTPLKTWRYKFSIRDKKLTYYSNGNFYLTTPIPENTTVTFIRADNGVEVKMKTKCLNHSRVYWDVCYHKDPGLPTTVVNNHYVSFQPPKNYSGAYQLMSISPYLRFYPKLKNFNDYDYVIQLADGFGYADKDKKDASYIDISISTYTVQIGESIILKCVTSGFYIQGIGFWTFIFKNGTQSYIRDSLLLKDEVTKYGSLFARTSEIVIDNYDIHQLACYGIKHYEIQKTNLVFKTSDHIEVETKQIAKKLDNGSTIFALSFFLTAFALMILIQFWLKWKKTIHFDKDFQKNLTDFFHGLKMEEINGRQCHLEALSKPYEKNVEILLKNLTIDWENPLGKGNTGYVLKSTLLNEKPSSLETSPLKTVAVKTLKPNSDSQLIAAMMSELKIMIYIGKHDNIVNLLGACTKQLTKKKLFIVMEYCKQGSLDKYLLNNRSSFINSLSPNDQSRINYCNVQFSRYELTTMDLLRWSQQIISGMEYLASKKIIHGDLASRNILLDELLIAKISDFGLSRQMNVDFEYVKQSEELLPWRWMAIESLKNMTFSEKSDVWSLGVTLWEIFSLAQTPYPGQSFTPTFIELLENNYRMLRPKYCSQKLYTDILVNCWKPNPEDRPTFERLGEMFQTILLKDPELSKIAKTTTNYTPLNE